MTKSKFYSVLVPVFTVAFSIVCPASAAETNVNPGINKSFLDPELKVGSFVERFEREGREVYDHREAIVKKAGIKPGKVVADIGAGTGLFEPLLSAAVGAGGKVIAVDIVPRFLSHVQNRAKELKLGNISTVLCTAKSTNLKPNSVDVVFICDTYHHFEYPQSTLKSIRAALRPDGEIFIVEFKRIAGQSTEWIMNHVRAGEEVFTKEIEDAGFEKVESLELLKDNYILRFRKRD